MHGLAGGNWKRSHDQAMATEKNNLTGNHGVQRLCDLLSIKATAPVPDPPSDVVGELLSASGEGSGDTEAAWRGNEGARCAHCRGPRGSNGGGPEV
jgi:hypothetical protein